MEPSTHHKHEINHNPLMIAHQLKQKFMESGHPGMILTNEVPTVHEYDIMNTIYDYSSQYTFDMII